MQALYTFFFIAQVIFIVEVAFINNGVVAFLPTKA